ncbi:MAG: ion transporter [Methanomicrobiaceae archaeon]|nr:ion transporter [Methanomicrobiaceae archaeon]
MTLMGYKSIKKRVYEVLEASCDSDTAGFVFDSCIVGLIALNIAVIILASVSSFYAKHYAFIILVSAITLVVFSAEYLLRLWTCNLSSDYQKPVIGRIKWMLTPYAIIDLLAILPFYLFIIFGVDVTGLIVLRVFRVFKIVRYSDSINNIIAVLKNEKDTLITSYAVLFIVLIVAATIMFQFENAAQPEAFSSIPASMWWGVITLATVGYGDITPITPAGKIFGSLIALIGIGIFALPAGILASGFARQLEKKDEAMEDERVYLCPHCKNEVRMKDLWRKK